MTSCFAYVFCFVLTFSLQTSSTEPSDISVVSQGRCGVPIGRAGLPVIRVQVLIA